MSSGDGMWCTFCIQSDTLNICNRPEWEDEYKFACDILGTLEDPTFTKIPLCDECLLSFRQLAVLRQQIIEVKKQLKERIQNSEQIADELEENVGEYGQIMRLQVRTFRNGVLERGDSLAKTTFRSLKRPKLTPRNSRRQEVGEDVVVKVEPNCFAGNEDNFFYDANSNDFAGNNQEEGKPLSGRKIEASSSYNIEDEYLPLELELTADDIAKFSPRKRAKPTAEELTCSHCSDKFPSKSQLKIHIRTIHAKCHKCPYCPFSSTSVKICGQHVLQSHPEQEEFRPFICEKCGMAFKTHSILNSHMKIHTRGTDKPFICHVCAFSTHTKGILTEHINIFHNIAFKKIQCYFCSKQCTKFANMTKHMMKHTGEKPYKCGKCDFASTAAWNIKIHLKTVHKNDEEEGRVYLCLHCSGKFRSHRSLLWHTNTIHEKSLKCPIPDCSFEALTRSTLKQHIEDNHPKGELNWPCTECPKRFQTQQNFQRHFRMHHQGENSIAARAAQFSQSQPDPTPTAGSYFTPYSTFQLPSTASYQNYQSNLNLNHPPPPPLTANPHLQYQQHEELLSHFIWPQQQQ